MSQFFIATSIYWKVRYIGQKYGKTNKKYDKVNKKYDILYSEQSKNRVGECCCFKWRLNA